MKSSNCQPCLETFSHPWVRQSPSRCERDHCIWQSPDIACVYCSNHSILCVVMEPHSKCAECTRRGRPCVGVTWESLDRVRNKLESEILQTEEEQARLFAKLSWLRKTLRQTQDRAKQKTLCLLKEMGNDNDGDEETPQPETLSQLLITCQTTFGSLILSPPLSKCWSVLAQPLRFSMGSHVFSEVLYPFTWRDSGLSANHPFS
jgi:hypothetical protein